MEQADSGLPPKCRIFCQTGDVGAPGCAVVLCNSTVEVVHESLEVREVMMVFDFVRQGRTAHQLPGHDFTVEFLQMAFQRELAGRSAKDPETDLGAVAAILVAKRPPLAVGQ